MSDLIQGGVVTLVALGAAVFVVRRVVGVVRPAADAPACDACSQEHGPAVRDRSA